MPYSTVLAVFLTFFLGLAGAQAVQGATSTPEEKLAEQLYLDASLHKARIPPLKQGQLRISGPLNSLGEYSYDGSGSDGTMRGCTWQKSRFGVMGHDSKGGGSAWFYADVDEQSGKVLSVTAYGNGTCGRGPDVAFFAAAPMVGSFGDVEKEGFTLRALGPSVSLLRGGGGPELKKWDAGIVITGNGDILTAADGAKIPVKYYLGSGDGVITEDKDPSGTNADSGTGIVTVEHYRKPDVIPTGKYVVPGLIGGAVLKKINDNTYSIDVDVRDGIKDSSSWSSNDCHPEDDMLVCRTEGLASLEDSETVPMNVRVRQVSPGKLILDADAGVGRLWCGAGACFTALTYEKR